MPVLGINMFYKVIIYILLCNKLVTESLPQATLSMHEAIDNFQNAVQQQTFQSVLLSIEGRLRNLDNIYSMQLSETLKSKLDQYHRKLESLDLKIIRLESLLMLNLNKILENISTQNYKEDIVVTQTYRKLDNMYDGLNHRINYMDRKSDMAFDKLQNKIDTTLLRMEKMEENMMQRNSDIESELSETLFVLEDLKTSSGNSEQSLLNITNILNQTVSNAPLMDSINLSMQNLIRNLNQSFTLRLEKLDNSSSKNLNISEENNNYLKSMKLELKEDFNEYANKVADMNTDVWKRNDIANESLKTIETVANSTRIEVQNGVRALMLQIGKLSGKGVMNNDKIYLESLKKSVNLSLEKIITNQELFLESCHRVQMDESQIESEISVMLGKLIDMLEKKMTTVMKDLKNLEKTVKNHDSRTTRNIYQANTNIVSLFEKTTRSSETTEKELQEIKFYINSLFTFIQDVLPKSTGVNGANQNIEVLLNDLSVNITNLIKTNDINTDIKWNQLERNFTKYNEKSNKFNDQLKNVIEILLHIDSDHHKILLNKIESFIKEMRNLVVEVKTTFSRLNPELQNSTFTNTNSTSNINLPGGTEKAKCVQNYGDLIDIRADQINCNENTDNTQPNSKASSTTEDEQLKQEILNIFGTPPPTINNSTENALNEAEVKRTKKKKKCILAWTDLIDVRSNSNRNNEECVESAKSKKKKHKKRMKSRFNIDDTVEYEDSIEELDGSTEDPTTIESSTESDSFSTEIPLTEHIELLPNTI